MPEIDEEQTCNDCGGVTELQRFSTFHQLVCVDCGKTVDKDLVVEEERAEREEDDEDVEVQE